VLRLGAVAFAAICIEQRTNVSFKIGFRQRISGETDNWKHSQKDQKRERESLNTSALHWEDFSPND
jgi:hypothetical protein